MVDYLLASPEAENLGVTTWNTDRTLSLHISGTISSMNFSTSTQWIKKCFLRLVWTPGPTHQLICCYRNTNPKKPQWQTDKDGWSVHVRFLQLWVSPEDRIKQYGFEISRKIIKSGIHICMFIIWCSEVQFSVVSCLPEGGKPLCSCWEIRWEMGTVGQAGVWSQWMAIYRKIRW